MMTKQDEKNPPLEPSQASIEYRILDQKKVEIERKVLKLQTAIMRGDNFRRGYENLIRLLEHNQHLHREQRDLDERIRDAVFEVRDENPARFYSLLEDLKNALKDVSQLLEATQKWHVNRQKEMLSREAACAEQERIVLDREQNLEQKALAFRQDRSK